MADELLRSKHAFGSESGVDQALLDKKIDAYDILFLTNEDGSHKIGWIDKNGNKIILEDKETDLSGIEAELETKADADEVKAELDMKANTKEVNAALEAKANAEEVNAKIDKVAADTVASANAYTDGKVEAALAEHLVKKYEISHKPEGTLVNYGEKEIRVMCPESTVWTKQNVGATGNSNYYYMGFKAYAPEGAVGFKEGDQGVIIDEYFDFTGEFAGTDEFGRNYSICWLALASYNESTDEWTYFGKNSTTSKYIGWTYIVEWYNADEVVIASDSIRINLSNEECYSSIEPYYLSDVLKTAKSYTDSQIAEVTGAITVVEF